MVRTFLKYLYYIAVVGIIWLIVITPHWLESTEIYIIFIVFCSLIGVCFFISYIAFTQLSRILEAANIISISEEMLDGEVKNLTNRFTKLGFTPANRPYQIGYKLPNVAIPFVHEKYNTYGWIVYREDALRNKSISFGFDSLLKENHASLGTIQSHLGVSMLQYADDLRQVFPEANIETLFEHHLKAIAYLKDRGIKTQTVTDKTFIEDRKKAIDRLYHRFRSSILKSTLVLLWRSISKRTPYNGPIENQKIAQEQIFRLQQYYSP